MNAKKCLILDLDNTLWGGILGEDGPSNIALGTTAPGNSFLAFQQAIMDLYNKGIMLAINSRNNEDETLAFIESHPNMILKKHHFSGYRINWNDKAANIKELAEELNIGLDSMVFLDDDPTNRSLVRVLVPEVEVPELPQDPKEYTRFLHSLPYFETGTITDEDKMRGNLYVTERLRKEEEKKYENKDEFLKSLGLELHLFKNDDSHIARLAQLTEKTNQFNIDKRPFTEYEVCSYIARADYDVYSARLLDTFGDHGIILFALVKKEKDLWTIESLLMSCRVFGRGVEDAFFAKLTEAALQEGVAAIGIAYTPTEKNAPAKEFITKYFDEELKRSLTQEVASPDWMNII